MLPAENVTGNQQLRNDLAQPQYQVGLNVQSDPQVEQVMLGQTSSQETTEQMPQQMPQQVVQNAPYVEDMQPEEQTGTMQMLPQQRATQQFNSQQRASQQFNPQQRPSQQFNPQQRPSQQFNPQQRLSQQFNPQQRPSQQLNPQQQFSQHLNSQATVSQQRPSQFVKIQQRPSQMIIPPRLSLGNRSRHPSQAGRLSILTGGIQVKSLSYVGFAKENFELSSIKATKDYQEQVDKHFQYTNVQIKEPLLKNMNGVKTKGIAITVFAHVMAYMGVIPGENDKLRHVYQILSAGISRPDLRDEIYCQICKQTYYNSNSEQDEKAWDLLVLCCSSFPPSKELLFSLEVHFQQVGIGAVEGFKGVEQAKRCYGRLQRVAKFGPRYFLPSPDEIEAIKSETQLSMEIFLPDKSNQVMSVHSMTTAEEVTTDIAKQIGLTEPTYYGIFQSGSNGVEKLVAQKAYMIDIQHGWNPALALQKVRDWRMAVKAKSFFSRRPAVDEVDDADEVSSIPTFVGKQKGRFIFKRKLFIHDPALAGQWGRDASIALDFTQAVHEVTSGAYSLTEQDALMLGALQLRADLPTTTGLKEEDLKGLDVQKYGPKTFLHRTLGDWRVELFKTITSFPHEGNKIVRMHDYTDFLKSRCPLYQSTWFFVKQEADLELPKEMFVAINETGVHFANPKTRDLQSGPPAQYTAGIRNWNYHRVVHKSNANLIYQHLDVKMLKSL